MQCVNVTQIILVAGGTVDNSVFSGDSDFSSVELFEGGVWRFLKDNLPFPVRNSRTIQLDNTIFMFGKKLTKKHSINLIFVGGQSITNYSGLVRNEILEFNAEKETWYQVKSMNTARHAHGISLVPLNELYSYCVHQQKYRTSLPLQRSVPVYILFLLVLGVFVPNTQIF